MMLGNLAGNTPWVVAAVAIFGFLGLLVRQIGPWRKIAADTEAHLRADLLRRVGKLERTLDRERSRRDAERSLDRHKLSNVTQCFDALLLLIEMAPEKAAEAVAKIKEMRARQLVAEAEEKAIIRAAEISAMTEFAIEEEEAAHEPE